MRTVTLIWGILSTLAASSCSAPETETPDMADAGLDSGDIVIEDSGVDAGVPAETKRQFGDPCERHADCARGLICHEHLHQCRVSATGCGGLSVPRDETRGCLWDHDKDPFEYLGIQSPTECETHDDCNDSPHGPHCITRVCHGSPPCETDEDCPEGSTCLVRTICLQ